MPGLFGVLSKTPELDDRELRAMGWRMAESMRTLPWLRAELSAGSRFCGGRVHLGVHNPEPQPCATRDGTSQTWFHGQVYPASAECGVTPDGDAIVRALAGAGQGLAAMDGPFSVACYTPAADELVLATDRFGSRPLFWTETTRWFAYASEVKALLAIMDTLPALDELAMMQFLSFDHMLGERTWWQDIELIPPGSIWRISPMGIARAQYWSFADIQRDVRHAAEVQEELGRVISRVIRQRRRPGPMPLLLSGGLDSRFLLAELRAQGAEVTAVTWGREGCSDMRLSSRCVRIAGVRHRKVMMTPETWWHQRDEAIWRTDGLVNAIHLHVAIALDELHRGNLHTLKNNSAGILFGGSRLRRLRSDWRSDPGELLASMYHRNPFFSADAVVEASRPDCEGYLCGPGPDCFTLRQRSRRMTLTGEIAMSAHCEVENPALALPVLQLMLGSLSEADRNGYEFYSRFLVERYPGYFANVPSQKTGRGYAESRPVWFVNGVRARLARIRGREENRYRDRFADYPALVQGSGMRERLLAGDLLIDECLGGAARRALSAGESEGVDARTVMSVLTAELYLRQVAAANGARDLSRYVELSPSWPPLDERVASSAA